MLARKLKFGGFLPGTNYSLSGCYTETGYSITQTSQVYLDNKAYETEGGFIAEWDYVEQLFEKKIIEDMHFAYVSLIEYLAENDWENTILATLPEVQVRLINRVNDTYRKDILPTITIHGAFIKQALKHPNFTAILSEKGHYTYSDLLCLSSRIARKLLDDGVKCNELTAVFCEKGFEQVASCLGIMEAGSAYFPFNIDWPLDRIENVLRQGNAKVIITTKTAFRKGNLNKLSGRYKIYFADITDVWESYSKEPILLPIDLNSTAYVIFTSGSIGTPKGVTISHYSAMNTISDVNNRFGVTSEDSIFALSNFSFDLSVYDIFGLLATGGQIVFPSTYFTKEPKEWVKLIIEQHISIWNTVPMLMYMLVEHIDTLETTDKKKLKNTLRLVLLSGDWIPTELPGRIKKYFPHSEVISLGGATEGSIWSILYSINDITDNWKSIPYGKAMYNQKMYILDNFLDFAPLGVIGEIHIGGVGVACNYWNDAEKTNESFVEHDKLGGAATH